MRNSAVHYWLRICLTVQETWARSHIWEDPTGHGTAEPMYHNY